jgi:hypothetical protein
MCCRFDELGKRRINKALHWAGIPLRSIPASELFRSSAIALSLALFAERRLPARTSSCPTRLPASSAPVAVVAWSPLGLRSHGARSPLGLQAHGARPFGPWPSGQARAVAAGRQTGQARRTTVATGARGHETTPNAGDAVYSTSVASD